MKKTPLALLLALCLTLLALPLSAGAASADPSFSAQLTVVEGEKPYYSSGDSFTVRVEMSADTTYRAGSLQLDLSYDPEVLTLTEEQIRPRPGDGWLWTLLPDQGELTLIWFLGDGTLTLSPEPLTALEMTFTVAEDVGGRTATALRAGEDNIVVSGDGAAVDYPLACESLVLPLTDSGSLEIVGLGEDDGMEIEITGLSENEEYRLIVAGYSATGRMLGLNIKVVSGQELDNGMWLGSVDVQNFAWADRFQALLFAMDDTWQPLRGAAVYTPLP